METTTSTSTYGERMLEVITDLLSHLNPTVFNQTTSVCCETKKNKNLTDLDGEIIPSTSSENKNSRKFSNQVSKNFVEELTMNLFPPTNLKRPQRAKLLNFSP